MGRDRHSDTVIDKGRKYTDQLGVDDTRYGVDTTHRGLPPKRGLKPSEIKKQLQEAIDQSRER